MALHVQRSVDLDILKKYEINTYGFFVFFKELAYRFFLGVTTYTSAQSLPKIQPNSTDLAKCSAAAARKLQLLEETKSLFPGKNIDTEGTLNQMQDFYKISCAFSTPTHTLDSFNAEQAKYQIRVQQVVERCKVSKMCIAEYMEELDATLRSCERNKSDNLDIIKKLSNTAPSQCVMPSDK